MNNLSKRMTVGITGDKEWQWKSKLKELADFKITRASLFLERYTVTQRRKIYSKLLDSNISDIPLVHLKNDMTRDELSFLAKTYDPYFTIHEDSFDYFKKWRGFLSALYLEMNYNNSVLSKVDVSRIGGFCIDLAHFKAAEERWVKEFEYIFRRKKIKKYFRCNHLSGYNFKNNEDTHTIKSPKSFDYLKTLPSFVFGDVIAIEVDNSIEEQLKCKEYIIKLFK